VYPDPVILPDLDGHTGLAVADLESDLYSYLFHPNVKLNYTF
jgi:hypothetical protein